jgi:hypothetical protein
LGKATVFCFIDLAPAFNSPLALPPSSLPKKRNEKIGRKRKCEVIFFFTGDIRAKNEKMEEKIVFLLENCPQKDYCFIPITP